MKPGKKNQSGYAMKDDQLKQNEFERKYKRYSRIADNEKGNRTPEDKEDKMKEMLDWD